MNSEQATRQELTHTSSFSVYKLPTTHPPTHTDTLTHSVLDVVVFIYGNVLRSVRRRESYTFCARLSFCARVHATKLLESSAQNFLRANFPFAGLGERAANTLAGVKQDYALYPRRTSRRRAKVAAVTAAASVAATAAAAADKSLQ